MNQIALWNSNLKIESIEDLFNMEASKYHHYLFKMIDELKRENADYIVIWGSYANAKKCKRFLDENYQIKADACVVNKEYINSPINCVDIDEDFPLVSLENWLNNHDDTDIIVDFSFFRTEMLQLYTKKLEEYSSEILWEHLYLMIHI